MATKTYDAAAVDALRAQVAELCEAIVSQHRMRVELWGQMTLVQELGLGVSTAEAHLEATESPEEEATIGRIQDKAKALRKATQAGLPSGRATDAT